MFIWQSWWHHGCGLLRWGQACPFHLRHFPQKVKKKMKRFRKIYNCDLQVFQLKGVNVVMAASNSITPEPRLKSSSLLWPRTKAFLEHRQVVSDEGEGRKKEALTSCTIEQSQLRCSGPKNAAADSLQSVQVQLVISSGVLQQNHAIWQGKKKTFCKRG